MNTERFVVLAIHLDTGCVVQKSDICTYERADKIRFEYLKDYEPCRVYIVPLR